MNELEQLKQRIEALEAWKAEREQRQLTYPLDTQTIEAINEHFLTIYDSIVYANAAGIDFTTFLVKQGSYRGSIGSGFPLFPFTVNTSTDVFTVSNSIVNGETPNFADDTQVLLTFRSGGSLPSPLLPNILYYVINSTGTTFQLSATLGGSAINVTSSGSGDLYIEPVN